MPGARKQHQKERRERERAEKRKQHQENDARRKAEEAARQERERQEEEARLVKKIAGLQNMKVSSIRVSSAKSAGLKSNFILDERTHLQTAFGRGNAAVPEKRITDGVVDNLNPTPAFETKVMSYQYGISGRVSGVSDDPHHMGQGTHTAARKAKNAEQGVGQSVGFLREKLEQKFYGQTFADNIHIQLIYSILDIEKLLASHINHIVYEINNLFRGRDTENPDFVGYLSLNLPYDEIRQIQDPDDKAGKNNLRTLNSLNLLMNNVGQRYYFSSAFCDWMYTPEGVNRKDKAAQEYWKYWNVYYRLCLLGMTRQALIHEDTEKKRNIYLLDEQYDRLFQSDPSRLQARKEARQMLDALYTSRVRELNENFLDTAKRNLVILFRAYHIQDQEKKAGLVRNYYRFIVRKDFKNLGFSIKKLREYLLDCILEMEHVDIKGEQNYDSVRHKMYQLFDFVLFDYFCTHPEEQDELVARLRCSMSGEEKEQVYITTAIRLLPEIRDVFLNGVLPEMDGNRISAIREDPDVSPEMLTEQIGEDAHTFTKLIYLLTLYLDGKEINDLLTGLISNLENIQAFQSVLEWENLPYRLADEYAMFEESGQIASELRIVNSFARMERKTAAGAKKVMFVEAAQVLGDDRSEEDLGRYFDDLLDPGHCRRLPDGSRDNRFRNFICNNVIDTPRFRYLVRYTDPGTVRELIRNHAVVMLVLRDIPDNQITRYYNTCMGVNRSYSPDMRDALAEKLENISFLEFEHAKSGKNLSGKEAEENERMKGIIRLYLTVLYLLVKNLVYINSRYTLAFHCLERDFALEYGQPVKKDRVNDLTRDAIEKKRLNYRARGYMETDLANSDVELIHIYRNKVAHLNAVRDAAKYIGDLRKAESYFAVYHYVMQRCLQSEYLRKTDPARRNPRVMEYFGALDEHHTYCKDLVKALNTPFGYNLPRFKNLSTDELFDRNRPGESKQAKTK